MSYARWERDYWQGRVREALGTDYEAVEVWHWLCASRSANDLGIYTIPFRHLAVDCFHGSPARSREIVARVYAVAGPLGAMKYRPATGEVWIVNCARKQHDPITSAKDKRRYSRAFRDELAKAETSPFWSEFAREYHEHLLLDVATKDLPETHEGPSTRQEGPSEGPSKDLPEKREGPSAPIPSHPIPPIPSHPTPAAAAMRTPAHAPAREAPAAAAPAARPAMVRAPTRDPWPEDASRAAADLWIALRREEGVEPLGDVCEPFERAALMLRDKHRIPAGEVSRTLERIVELAHISPTVRASRHGDLFRDTFHLLGNPNPKGGGVPMVDKLRRYLEDLAHADARARASEPIEPAEIPYEEERAIAKEVFDDEGYADWLHRNAHRAPPTAQEGSREALVPPGGGIGHEAPQNGPQWPSAMCELSDPRAGGPP